MRLDGCRLALHLMSDEERTDAEKFAASRTGIVEAMQNALQQFEVTGMITGFVAVMEYMDEDGDYEVWWLTGTGAPSDDSTAGIPSWRLEGLLKKVERDIDARNTSSE